MPRVRKSTFRLPPDAAYHVRVGNPFVYRDTLHPRVSTETAGDVVELLDEEGRFVARGLYDPEGNIAVRVLTRDPKEDIDAGLFVRKVQAAKQLRERCLPTESLTAYRVLHTEGDFLPGCTVDRYGDHLLIQQFTSALTRHINTLCDALQSTWHPKGIYLQKRMRPLTGEGVREPAELIRGSVAPLDIEVQEGPLRFYVDVTAPIGTGLFPDLRLGRERIASQCAGKRVLNLFSYAGAISLYAAWGGATSVTSVDLSAKAHARARRNLSLNQMPEDTHTFVTGEAFTVLSKMREQQQQFDVIVLDPPSFSQSNGKPFSVQQDYAQLVAHALGVLAPDGLLYCCSNTLRFSRVDMEIAMGEGAGRGRRLLRIVEQVGLPPDFPIPGGFPDGHYLKCYGCVVT